MQKEMYSIYRASNLAQNYVLITDQNNLNM